MVLSILEEVYCMCQKHILYFKLGIVLCFVLQPLNSTYYVMHDSCFAYSLLRDIAFRIS